MRLLALLALVACGKKAPESTQAVAEQQAPIAEPKNVAPDLPLPEGAAKRLGGSRFRHAGRVTAVAVSPDASRPARATTRCACGTRRPAS